MYNARNKLKAQKKEQNFISDAGDQVMSAAAHAAKDSHNLIINQSTSSTVASDLCSGQENTKNNVTGRSSESANAE